MAITFEREQQATIQAYHRNRHDPRIKDLGVDTVLDMVRIFRIRKYWFYRYLSWARYGWSWASNFFYPEHHLGWYARIWNFCGATRPTSRLVKITSQKNLRIFMQLGCCETYFNKIYRYNGQIWILDLEFFYPEHSLRCSIEWTNSHVPNCNSLGVRAWPLPVMSRFL